MAHPKEAMGEAQQTCIFDYRDSNSGNSEHFCRHSRTKMLSNLVDAKIPRITLQFNQFPQEIIVWSKKSMKFFRRSK